MSIKSRKLFAIIVMTAMILTLLPMTAFAASKNSVDKVPQVADGHPFKSDPPVLTIEDTEGRFSTEESFRLILTNAEWLKDGDDYVLETEAVTGLSPGVTVDVLTAKVAEVKIERSGSQKAFDIPLYTVVKGEGEVKVEVDSRDSRVSSGTYTFAISAEGTTIVSIDKVKTFARSVTLGDIQIDETRIGSLGTGSKTIKIKLPPRFYWDIASSWGAVDRDIIYSGGLSDCTFGATDVTGNNERTLVFKINIADTTRTARGSIFLKNLKIRADRDAPYGDVVVDFEESVKATDLLVAKYAPYTIEVDVKEVKEVVAGRYDNKTAKITIKENLSGAFIEGREISVVLPEWVKITKVHTKNSLTANDLNNEKRKNEIYFLVSETSEGGKTNKYEFELELSVEADKTGDIVAEFFGAGLEKQEVVIAEAVAPITAEVAVSDLKIGVQDQPAPDIIIKETKKGMIDDYIAAYYWDDDDEGFLTSEYFALTVSLPKDHNFAGTPTVTVEEGNLEIGKPSAKDNVLTIPIKSSSTKPSTIKISDIKVTLDRTVPEGPFKASIGGTAIVKNDWERATITTEVVFDKPYVVKFHYADVITPAPGETRATTTFTIGSTTYTVVEAAVAVEKTMDVAPYIKDGRTYLPVRFVADALGVTEDNIIWDPVNATVTIFKGDRIAQMTIGSKILLVNGVQLTMDAAPEIVSGRTMLPVRWMAQALGATIEWDPETQQVTVTQ